MKKMIEAVTPYIFTIVLGAAMAYGGYRCGKCDEEYAKELQEHVIETWKDAPEDFHGHNCKYGDWCTKSFYDYLQEHK